MRKILSFLMWTVAFLALLVILDQLLVRLPAPQALVTFYRDLRIRVVELARGTPPALLPAPKVPAPPERPAPPGAPQAPPAVEGLTEPHRPAPKAPATALSKKAAAEPALRYVYVDRDGNLHFAATLAEIPVAYRGGAKQLGE